jgi:hypothetical protein
VLIAGKGHEQGQYVAGAVIPFDDREVASEALLRHRASEDATITGGPQASGWIDPHDRSTAVDRTPTVDPTGRPYPASTADPAYCFPEDA